MLQLDYRDKSPIYEQIRDRMKELIIRGIIKSDERIPSVRELAQTLTINPNTIQKAYRELEEKGYIYSVKGRGSFVSPSPQWADDKKIDELYQSFSKIVTEMSYLGVDKNRLITAINSLYQGKEGDGAK